MPDSHVTAQLDQLAAHVAQQREAGGTHITALIELELGVVNDLTTVFPDLDRQTLGAIVLHLGGRATALLNRLSDAAKPNAGAILANVLQMAGQRLYTANPPAVWTCPYTLPGGVACSRVLNAPNEAELEPRIAGHLDLSHPGTRRERRA